MAKPIVVSLKCVESSFDLSKVERKRLYGERRRLPLDADGEICVKSSLTTDGLYLLQSGMTAQGYFDETGRWLQKSQLVGVATNGQVLEIQGSTLGVCQALLSIDPSVILAHAIDAVYALDPIAVDAGLQSSLDAGAVYSFGFNYSADYHQETAFLIKNGEGVFCLVGVPVTSDWSEPGKVTVADDEGDSTDDLDFEMF